MVYFVLKALLTSGAAALLISAGAAQAGSFYLIDAGTKSMTALDRNAVHWEGSNPTVTVSVIYAYPQMLPGAGAKLYFQQADYRQELRCKEQQYRTAAVDLMDASGKSLVKAPIRDFAWRPIDKATVLAPITALICHNVVPASSGPFADLRATKEAYFALLNEGAIKGEQ